MLMFLESESLTAVRCLAYFMIAKCWKALKGPSNNVVIPHYLMEAVVSAYTSLPLYIEGY